MRRCIGCGQELPESMFVLDRSKASGFGSRCRACDRERVSAYYAANRTEVLRRAASRRGVQVPKPRFCKCGAPTSSSRHWYCDRCRAAAQKARNSAPRPKTNSRDYGWEHQKERRRVTAIVDAGRASCARCAQPIIPGELWDLDHLDDKSGYRGPAHRRCNRSAGAAKGNRQRVLAR